MTKTNYSNSRVQEVPDDQTNSEKMSGVHKDFTHPVDLHHTTLQSDKENLIGNNEFIGTEDNSEDNVYYDENYSYYDYYEDNQPDDYQDNNLNANQNSYKSNNVSEAAKFNLNVYHNDFSQPTSMQNQIKSQSSNLIDERSRLELQTTTSPSPTQAPLNWQSFNTEDPFAQFFHTPSVKIPFKTDPPPIGNQNVFQPRTTTKSPLQRYPVVHFTRPSSPLPPISPTTVTPVFSTSAKPRRPVFRLNPATQSTQSTDKAQNWQRFMSNSQSTEDTQNPSNKLNKLNENFVTTPPDYPVNNLSTSLKTSSENISASALPWKDLYNFQAPSSEHKSKVPVYRPVYQNPVLTTTERYNPRSPVNVVGSPSFVKSNSWISNSQENITERPNLHIPKILTSKPLFTGNEQSLSPTNQVLKESSTKLPSSKHSSSLYPTNNTITLTPQQKIKRMHAKKLLLKIIRKLKNNTKSDDEYDETFFSNSDYVYVDTEDPYLNSTLSMLDNDGNFNETKQKAQRRTLDLLYHMFIDPTTDEHGHRRNTLIEDLIRAFDEHIVGDIQALREHKKSGKQGQSHFQENNGDFFKTLMESVGLDRNFMQSTADLFHEASVDSHSDPVYSTLTTRKPTPRPTRQNIAQQHVRNSNTAKNAVSSPEKVQPTVPKVTALPSGEEFIVTDDNGEQKIVSINNIIESLSSLSEDEAIDLLFGSTTQNRRSDHHEPEELINQHALEMKNIVTHHHPHPQQAVVTEPPRNSQRKNQPLNAPNKNVPNHSNLKINNLIVVGENGKSETIPLDSYLNPQMHGNLNNFYSTTSSPTMLAAQFLFNKNEHNRPFVRTPLSNPTMEAAHLLLGLAPTQRSTTTTTTTTTTTPKPPAPTTKPPLMLVRFGNNWASLGNAQQQLNQLKQHPHLVSNSALSSASNTQKSNPAINIQEMINGYRNQGLSQTSHNSQIQQQAVNSFIQRNRDSQIRASLQNSSPEEGSQVLMSQNSNVHHSINTNLNTKNEFQPSNLANNYQAGIPSSTLAQSAKSFHQGLERQTKPSSTNLDSIVEALTVSKEQITAKETEAAALISNPSSESNLSDEVLQQIEQLVKLHDTLKEIEGKQQSLSSSTGSVNSNSYPVLSSYSVQKETSVFLEDGKKLNYNGNTRNEIPQQVASFVPGQVVKEMPTIPTTTSKPVVTRKPVRFFTQPPQHYQRKTHLQRQPLPTAVSSPSLHASSMLRHTGHSEHVSSQEGVNQMLLAALYELRKQNGRLNTVSTTPPTTTTTTATTISPYELALKAIKNNQYKSNLHKQSYSSDAASRYEGPGQTQGHQLPFRLPIARLSSEDTQIPYSYENSDLSFLGGLENANRRADSVGSSSARHQSLSSQKISDEDDRKYDTSRQTSYSKVITPPNDLGVFRYTPPKEFRLPPSLDELENHDHSHHSSSHHYRSRDERRPEISPYSDDRYPSGDSFSNKRIASENRPNLATSMYETLKKALPKPIHYRKTTPTPSRSSSSSFMGIPIPSIFSSGHSHEEEKAITEEDDSEEDDLKWNDPLGLLSLYEYLPFSRRKSKTERPKPTTPKPPSKEELFQDALKAGNVPAHISKILVNQLKENSKSRVPGITNLHKGFSSSSPSNRRADKRSNHGNPSRRYAPPHYGVSHYGSPEIHYPPHLSSDQFEYGPPSHKFKTSGHYDFPGHPEDPDYDTFIVPIGQENPPSRAQPLFDLNFLFNSVKVKKIGKKDQSFALPQIGDPSKFVNIHRPPVARK